MNRNRVIKIKRSVAMTMLVILPLSLIGCTTSKQDSLMKDSKSNIVVQYRQLEADYTKTLQEYQNYKQSVIGTSGEDVDTPGISQIGDGSGRYTFTSKDSTIVFPIEFTYPSSTNVSSSGSIQVTDKVSVEATDNWITNICGSTLTLEHSSGISGTIKVGTVDILYNVDKLKGDILSTWASILPPATVKYSDVYLLGMSTKVGVQMSTPTYIDSNDACLKCGMLGYNKTVVSYAFTYRGTQDNTKDELIKSVLNSLVIENNMIKVE